MKHIPIVAIAMLSFGVAALCAQGAQSGSPNSNEPANWRDVPVRLHAHPDTASASQRNARDQYWGQFFPATGGFLTTTRGRHPIQDLPEIVNLLDAFWAVGTFTGYDVYPISTAGIYTEMHFRIERVIGPSENTSLRGGETFDVGAPGGTIAMPSGEIAQQKGWEEAYQYPPIPNGRYLIQLVPVPQGSFYIVKDYWDLTTGKVKPVLPRAKFLAQNGNSRLTGTNEDQAIDIVQASLSTLHKALTIKQQLPAEK